MRRVPALVLVSVFVPGKQELEGALHSAGTRLYAGTAGGGVFSIEVE